MRNGFELIL